MAAKLRKFQTALPIVRLYIPRTDTELLCMGVMAIRTPPKLTKAGKLSKPGKPFAYIMAGKTFSAPDSLTVVRADDHLDVLAGTPSSKVGVIVGTWKRVLKTYKVAGEHDASFHLEAPRGSDAAGAPVTVALPARVGGDVRKTDTYWIYVPDPAALPPGGNVDMHGVVDRGGATVGGIHRIVRGADIVATAVPNNARKQGAPEPMKWEFEQMTVVETEPLNNTTDDPRVQARRDVFLAHKRALDRACPTIAVALDLIRYAYQARVDAGETASVIDSEFVTLLGATIRGFAADAIQLEEFRRYLTWHNIALDTDNFEAVELDRQISLNPRPGMYHRDTSEAGERHGKPVFVPMPAHAFLGVSLVPGSPARTNIARHTTADGTAWSVELGYPPTRTDFDQDNDSVVYRDEMKQSVTVMAYRLDNLDLYYDAQMCELYCDRDVIPLEGAILPERLARSMTSDAVTVWHVLAADDTEAENTVAYAFVYAIPYGVSVVVLPERPAIPATLVFGDREIPVDQSADLDDLPIAPPEDTSKQADAKRQLSSSERFGVDVAEEQPDEDPDEPGGDDDVIEDDGGVFTVLDDASEPEEELAGAAGTSASRPFLEPAPVERLRSRLVTLDDHVYFSCPFATDRGEVILFATVFKAVCLTVVGPDIPYGGGDVVETRRVRTTGKVSAKVTFASLYAIEDANSLGQSAVGIRQYLAGDPSDITISPKPFATRIAHSKVGREAFEEIAAAALCGMGTKIRDIPLGMRVFETYATAHNYVYTHNAEIPVPESGIIPKKFAERPRVVDISGWSFNDTRRKGFCFLTQFPLGDTLKSQYHTESYTPVSTFCSYQSNPDDDRFNDVLIHESGTFKTASVGVGGAGRSILTHTVAATHFCSSDALGVRSAVAIMPFMWTLVAQSLVRPTGTRGPCWSVTYSKPNADGVPVTHNAVVVPHSGLPDDAVCEDWLPLGEHMDTYVRLVRHSTGAWVIETPNRLVNGKLTPTATAFEVNPHTLLLASFQNPRTILVAVVGTAGLSNTAVPPISDTEPRTVDIYLIQPESAEAYLITRMYETHRIEPHLVHFDASLVDVTHARDPQASAAELHEVANERPAAAPLPSTKLTPERAAELAPEIPIIEIPLGNAWIRPMTTFNRASGGPPKVRRHLLVVASMTTCLRAYAKMMCSSHTDSLAGYSVVHIFAPDSQDADKDTVQTLYSDAGPREDFPGAVFERVAPRSSPVPALKVFLEAHTSDEHGAVGICDMAALRGDGPFGAVDIHDLCAVMISPPLDACTFIRATPDDSKLISDVIVESGRKVKLVTSTIVVPAGNTILVHKRSAVEAAPALPTWMIRRITPTTSTESTSDP
jgi:hypothetical protein